jgi:hypothetical protein
MIWAGRRNASGPRNPNDGLRGPQRFGDRGELIAFDTTVAPGRGPQSRNRFIRQEV